MNKPGFYMYIHSSFTSEWCYTFTVVCSSRSCHIGLTDIHLCSSLCVSNFWLPVDPVMFHGYQFLPVGTITDSALHLPVSKCPLQSGGKLWGSRGTCHPNNVTVTEVKQCTPTLVPCFGGVSPFSSLMLLSNIVDVWHARRDTLPMPVPSMSSASRTRHLIQLIFRSCAPGPLKRCEAVFRQLCEV